MQLERSTALVTGASRGLGRALAAALAAAGARVVMVARGGAALEAAAAALRASGHRVEALAFDVGDVERAGELAARAAALAGPVDLLVHNASTLGALPLPVLLDTDPADFERVLRVNLLGPFALSRAIVGSMLVHGGGSVVHVSSDAAVAAYPGWGAYGAAKAAADHLTRIWAAELAGTAVRFVAVDPGEMDTEMHAAAVPDADRTALARPEAVAGRIVGWLRDAARSTSGSRWVAAGDGP